MLKGAILGLGSIARRAHLPALLSDEVLQRKVEIVAAADPQASHRAEAEHMLPGLRTYPSAEALLEHEKIDFVDICAPPSAHFPLIRTAAQHECHIVCEKPIAPDALEMETVRRLLEPVPVVFMPCHQYRYSAVWRELGELLRSGRLGTIAFAQLDLQRRGPDPGSMDWRPFWRMDPAVSGGGILTDTGIHYIYLMLWLLGAPERVWATTRSVRDERAAVEDTALVVLNYPHGWVQLSLSWAAQRRDTRFSFVGSRAAAVYDGTRLSLLEDGTETELVHEALSDKASYVQWYASLFRNFVAHVEKQSRDVRDGDGLVEAIRTMRILQACYESARLHREVTVVL